MEDKKVLLSVQDLDVKFHVRGRILTAIRGISLDIYENESIAIVGESGSGKSVFTKTFAGMLEQNGFIANGKIIFNDDELNDTRCSLDASAKKQIESTYKKLNLYSKYIYGAKTHKEIMELESKLDAKSRLSEEEVETYNVKTKELNDKITDLSNLLQTFSKKEKEEITKTKGEIKALANELKELEKAQLAREKEVKEQAKNDTEYNNKINAQLAELKAKYEEEISKPLPDVDLKNNLVIAKEIYLSVARYSRFKRVKMIKQLEDLFKQALIDGIDIDDEQIRNDIFDPVAFRIRLLDEGEDFLHGTCISNLANVKLESDWTQIRGKRISTVFQDPMTSLNPVITIGKQITSVIMKHQNVSEVEARKQAIQLMNKVGIPNAEKRFDDYPFQYSGGMRQRIVIAIALSCQPKILICDEPTTALDVTIQAQILKLIKDLQKEFNYTIVFITHDLGVVANIADRVAVLYAGQIIELGTVEDIFYDPRHPYTWALLSSLPQLAQRNTKLYSITGTPPSLYNKIVGDAFAPRNPYCMKIDTVVEPPMFKVSETHWAKTWLLDERSPKVNKPEIIENIHEKLMDSFNI